MAKRWRIASHDPDRIMALQRAAKVPAVVAQLLICRGIVDAGPAREFLDPKLSGLRDPELLPGARQAAKQLAAAVAAGHRIVVYGDYDADGMTGTSILLLCLRLLGGDVGSYVPNRMNEGYGLHDDALRKLAAEGAKLIVTVDCGITSVAEAQTARQLGLQLVITDHHEMADTLPEADVLVHPRLPGHSYPFAGLAGAGVAFKVAWALCQEVAQAKRVSPRMRTFLLQAVGLAAIGTVADVVPLIDENRILVRHGLGSLYQSPTLGVAALAEVCKLNEKPYYTSEDIAFTLAPRLNAAGRLGQAQLAVELLATSDAARAETLAHYIHELNGERDRLERGIIKAARAQAESQFDPASDAALVLADRDWHPGVIGIVAGRLAERYHRPVVIISLDKLGARPGTGSARSVPGFNLHAALSACADSLIRFGGHAAAAGLTIEERQLAQFREEFCAYADSEISQEDRVAELWIDAETPLSALSLSAVEQIERLAPFGHANTRPMLCATDVSLAGPPRRMGGGGRHLSLNLVQHGTKLRSVAFGCGDWAEPLAEATAPLAFAFKPTINNFRGRRNVELLLADWRIADSDGADD